MFNNLHNRIICAMAAMAFCTLATAQFRINLGETSPIRKLSIAEMAINSLYVDSVDENKVIVSIAAGKTINWLAKEFEKPVKLIRVMPNTPALVLSKLPQQQDSIVENVEKTPIVILFLSLAKLINSLVEFEFLLCLNKFPL